MILGDFVVIILMGFYAGVGIWESGTVRHILGMIVPSLVVWGVSALLFKLYKDLPRSIGAVRWKELSPFVNNLIKFQKPRQVLFVWAITCVFQTFWISFYWRGIIYSQSYFYRFSLGTAVWYVTSYATFFLLWRGLWMVANIVIGLARSYRWVRAIGIGLQVLIVLYAAAIIVINLHYNSRKYRIDNV
ncbi:MAG: hypothetical protein IJI41_13985, partial [Anaerolineaceae bacterium]|nr:hypothetical protein [Anaerolineaceae bacterium]